MELSGSEVKKLLILFLKKILIFQEGTCKARKSKVFYASPKRSSPAFQNDC